MEKIAHASSMERCKLQIKKLKKQKVKKKITVNNNKLEMGEEAYEAMLKERSVKSIAQIVNTALWDIKHKQFPMSKKSYIIPKMKERLLEEITPEERQKIEVALKWFSE